MSDRRKRKRIILQSCVFASLFVIILLLNLNIRLSRDDFYYYSYARHGAADFIKLLSEHYFTINGKLLTNGLCAVFLKLGLVPFRAANIAVLFLTGIFLSVFAESDKPRRVYIFLMAIAGILLIGNTIFAESILWIDGSCNYLFPAALLAAYLYSLIRADGKSCFITAALGALSALTSELSAIVTLAATVFALAYMRGNKRAGVTCLIFVFCGFLFLLLSPGMHIRLENVNSPELFWDNLAADFTLFSQMIWEKGGAGAIVIFSALSCAVRAYNMREKTIAAVMGAVALAAVLTSCGVIYSAACYVIFNTAYFVFLVVYAIILYRSGDRIIPLCAALLGLSFAFICAAGIVGFRMIFLPALCVIMIGLRSLAAARLRMKYMNVICVLMALAAVIQTSGMIGANFNNSRIWDENQLMIENYSGGDLVFKDVYDESVFRGAIPEDGNFNTYYFSEFGIDENVRAYIGNQYYRIADEHGRIVSEEAVKKRGMIYIPLADAAKYIGAKVKWHCSAAEMTYGDEMLRFREYTYSAMTARFGGQSKKLKYPVRNLSSTTYISLYDINALFNLKLSE